MSAGNVCNYENKELVLSLYIDMKSSTEDCRLGGTQIFIVVTRVSFLIMMYFVG